MKTTEAFPPMQLDLIPRKHIYQVYFRSDLQSGMREFDADTPEEALRLARRFVAERPEHLVLDYNETDNVEIDEIEVCDNEYNSLAVWYHDDLRLRLSARDLLDAAELVISRWSEGDLAEAVRALDAAIARATGGAQ